MGKKKTAEATTEAPKVAGRGRKTCPACGKVVGARSVKCECGHEFTPKKTKTADRKPKPKTVPPSDGISPETFNAIAQFGKAVKAVGGRENALKLLDLIQ